MHITPHVDDGMRLVLIPNKERVRHYNDLESIMGSVRVFNVDVTASVRKEEAVRHYYLREWRRLVP